MKFISAIYMPRRNFWCMTRGGCQQKIFHLQKGDGGQSGSQDLMKTVDLSGKTYISSISDPKGTAFRGIHFWFWKKCFYETPYWDNWLSNSSHSVRGGFKEKKPLKEWNCHYLPYPSPPLAKEWKIKEWNISVLWTPPPPLKKNEKYARFKSIHNDLISQPYTLVPQKP